MSCVTSPNRPDPRPEPGAARWSFLGPAGTFSEVALEALAAVRAATPVAVARPTVAAALDDVRTGTSVGAVVPIENSVEGGVNITLDELRRGTGLRIAAEVHMPVRFALLATPGRTLDAVRRIATHPHAAAQCRTTLAREVPHALVVTETSTARAAQRLLDADSPHDAAVAAPTAARTYGLQVLLPDVADHPGAVTRFVLVVGAGADSSAGLPEPTGKDRTSVVAYLRENRSGALLELLTQFASRGVDLSRIESRPTGDALGSYCFSLDAVGHVRDPQVAAALADLGAVAREVRFLGSYPTLAAGVADPDDSSRGQRT